MNALASSQTEELSRFFERFATAGSEVDGYADLFAEVFLNLDPLRADAVAKETLIAYLPARGQMFATIGVEGLDFAGIRDAVQIDDQHVLATTDWTARFLPRRGQEPLFLESTYLLRRHDQSWRVVVYLNHQDMAAVLAQRSGTAVPVGPEMGGKPHSRMEIPLAKGNVTPRSTQT